jgi:rhodanese-related sulfurtransferase
VSDRFSLLAPDALRDALAEPRPPVLVDVRSAHAFELGHIPGSRNIPVYDLGARRPELPANLARRLVVIGDHRKRAHAAARFLELIGFGDVAILEGGIATWGGPLDQGPVAPPPQQSGPELRVLPAEPDDSDGVGD